MSSSVFLSSKSCFTCCGICLASSKVYFACGVAWLVGLLGLLRGGTLSLAFSVSINKLKIYEYHFMIHFTNFGCWDFSLELRSGLGFVLVLQF